LAAFPRYSVGVGVGEMELGGAFQPELRRSTNESGVRCKERRVAVMNCKAHHVNANTLSLCRSIRHLREPASRLQSILLDDRLRQPKLDVGIVVFFL